MSKRIPSRFLRQLSQDINPDEIFLDAKNLPSFDKDQFEGRIEKPIDGSIVWWIFVFFTLIIIIFFVKVVNLQVVEGENFLRKSENNRLDQQPLFALRGVIYDRNKTPLAWNSFNRSTSSITSTTSSTLFLDNENTFPRRTYISAPGFGHLLGFVTYPKRDKSGRYYQEVLIGKDGIEEYYNDILAGQNGFEIIEVDALGKTHSGNIIDKPKDGTSIILGIDARVEERLYMAIRDLAASSGYMAGAGGLMDIQTGELLALTSFPEYESTVLSDAQDKKTIQDYSLDKRAVFLDRAVSGIYTPGSIVKPFMSIAALAEGVITPEKQILSSGSISIQNPYYPDIKSVFNDWKVHGWVDMRRAIAVSSDVYFYAIGGGYQDQKGIGIANIEKYSRMFGFGSLTGIDITSEKEGTIPSPSWKAKIFNGEPWRLGNTYHTVIGQYGFQVTLLQALRATASLVNGGVLVTPHLLKNPTQDFPSTTIQISDADFKVAREGMRDAVVSSGGTVGGLNVGYVTVAGKTGTAEIDAGKKYINSWIIGFFPYEKPRYAFAVVMERGPHDNTLGGVYVMRQLLDWMHLNTPEYLESN